MKSFLKITLRKAGSALILGGIFSGLATINASASGLHQASITDSFNTVSYQASADSPQKAATTGTVIHPSNIVRTGVDSRAELEFNDKTITRMGANSFFSFDEAKQIMDLQQGSVLFSKPKNSDTFEIATPAATCSISGTTGFAYYLAPVVKSTKSQGTMLFGLIEGETSVTVGGKTYPIGSGQLLVSTGGLVQVINFNLVSFLDKAGLVKKFKSKLPNAADITKAANHFTALAKRGFTELTAFSLALNHNQLELLESLIGQNAQPNTQLASQIQNSEIGQMKGFPQSGGGGGFVNVGGSGIIHGQLIWNLDVDLDLHLILPASSVAGGVNNNVEYFNRSVTQTTGAVATLDTDDTGAVNGPGTERGKHHRHGNAGDRNLSIIRAIFCRPYRQFDAGIGSLYLILTGNGGQTTQRITGTLTTPGGLSGQTTPILTVTR